MTSLEAAVAPQQAVIGSEGQPNEIEVSIVMPCLNEVRTVPSCVRKAVSWLEARAIRGEVIVADNGSTDGSIESSEQVGGRVVRISNKGDRSKDKTWKREGMAMP